MERSPCVGLPNDNRVSSALAASKIFTKGSRDLQRTRLSPLFTLSHPSRAILFYHYITKDQRPSCEQTQYDGGTFVEEAKGKSTSLTSKLMRRFP